MEVTIPTACNALVICGCLFHSCQFPALTPFISLIFPVFSFRVSVFEEGARYVYRTVKDVRFPLSVRNERAAMQRLLALVKDSLDGYPTSLKEDRLALKVGLETFAWEVEGLVCFSLVGVHIRLY